MALTDGEEQLAGFAYALGSGVSLSECEPCRARVKPRLGATTRVTRLIEDGLAGSHRIGVCVGVGQKALCCPKSAFVSRVSSIRSG